MDVALEKSPCAEVPKVQSIVYDVNLSGKRTELIIRSSDRAFSSRSVCILYFRARSRLEKRGLAFRFAAIKKGKYLC